MGHYNKFDIIMKYNKLRMILQKFYKISIYIIILHGKLIFSKIDWAAFIKSIINFFSSSLSNFSSFLTKEKYISNISSIVNLQFSGGKIILVNSDLAGKYKLIIKVFLSLLVISIIFSNLILFSFSRIMLFVYHYSH